MNEEYVLLCGAYWKLKGVPVFFWRNHLKGSLLTRLAVLLSSKVFCTSKSSFTARFKKTKIMPVGNDTNMFKPILGVIRKNNSVCMLGRIAPIKHIELAIEAVKIIVSHGCQISLSIIGSPEKKDIHYYENLKKFVSENKLSSYVNFIDEVPFEKHPEIFSSYEICLNLTKTGSFDKTILGGASCGAVPLVSNESLREMLPAVCVTSNLPKDIASSIEKLLDVTERIKIQDEISEFVKSQSLDSLIKKLNTEMK